MFDVWNQSDLFRVAGLIPDDAVDFSNHKRRLGHRSDDSLACGYYRGNQRISGGLYHDDVRGAEDPQRESD